MKKKMVKLNICLKLSSICVIGVIAVICLLVLGLTLFLHGYILYDEKAEDSIMGLHALYGFTTVTLVLAIFGGFGTLKEKKWALIVFAVGMTLGCMLLVVSEISMQIAKPKLENLLRNHYLTILPLTNTSESELDSLNTLQSTFQCCGVEKGYMDWNNNIPTSCQCNNKSINPCVENIVEGQSVMIYAKPCIPVLIAESMHHLNVSSGIRVGFLLLWMLSIGLCIAILCQLKKKLETPSVVYSQEAKAGNYSCLIEYPDTYNVSK